MLNSCLDGWIFGIQSYNTLGKNLGDPQYLESGYVAKLHRVEEVGQLPMDVLVLGTLVCSACMGDVAHWCKLVVVSVPITELLTALDG